MIVKDYKDLRTRARKEIGDISGQRWLDAELDRYIDAGQREYAVRKFVLDGQATITSNGTQNIFNCPDDFIIADRFKDSLGNDLSFYSFRQLANDYTAKFLTEATSRPLVICFDYENWNRFRVYPTALAGTVGTLFYHRFPVKGVLEIKDSEALYYYLLWWMHMTSGDKKGFKKGFYFRQEFEKRLHSSKVFKSNLSTKRRGYFF